MTTPIAIKTSITVLRPGLLRAEYWHPATGRSVSHQTTTRRDARAWLAQKTAEAAANPQVDPALSRMTLDEFMADYFWVVFPPVRDEETIYRLYIQDRFGSIPLGEITKDRVGRWAAGLKTTRLATSRTESTATLSSGYARRIYMEFHKIMRIAHEQDYITHLPLTRTMASTLPPTTKAKITFALEPEQVAELADKIERNVRVRPGRNAKVCVVADWPFMHKVMIYTFAYGGFRPSEGLALRLNDLDFKHNCISVDEQLHRQRGLTTTLKRKRSHRTVHVAEGVMKLLRQHVDMNVGWDDPTALLFTNKLGQRLGLGGWRVRWFTPVVTEMGLAGMVPHDLRHTAASGWFDEGFVIEEVAEFLGDSVAVARDVYVHMFQGRRSERHVKMDERFLRGLGQSEPLPANVFPLRAQS